MRLRSLRVRNFRSISDSGWVDADGFTCLIGKNESGKTGFMRAIERLNPVHSLADSSPREEYPRHEWPEYDPDSPAVFASARLELDAADVEAVEAEYGDVLAGTTAVVHRRYESGREWELDLDPDADGSTDDLADEIGADRLADRLPEFRYVGEYATMPGTIDLPAIRERREDGSLTREDRVFLSLLSIAELGLDEFDSADDWRETVAELEAASASVTADAMRYWSQSGDIRLRIQPTPGEDGSLRSLDLRVENRDSGVTVPFEQRSHGFRRFLSMFCQLSALGSGDGAPVLLLDEPGLNLHPRAKREFRAFLREEIAAEAPLVYSTHSPFMIDPERLDAVNMVAADPRGDTNVFGDVSLADEYTSFPLRNVFELDLLDTLLVQPQVLVVERKADHAYLSVASRLLKDAGEDGLDDRWTVVPITDADNIDRFVSLFGGEQLDVAALLAEHPGTGRSDDAAGDDLAIELVSEYGGVDGGTIEDVFSEAFYLELVGRTYASALGATGSVPDRITADELASVAAEGPIVDRVAAYFEEHGIDGGRFDRTAPALYLQRNRAELREAFDSTSRRRFTRLFTDLDNVLRTFEGVDPRSRSLFDVLGL